MIFDYIRIAIVEGFSHFFRMFLVYTEDNGLAESV